MSRPCGVKGKIHHLLHYQRDHGSALLEKRLWNEFLLSRLPCLCSLMVPLGQPYHNHDTTSNAIISGASKDPLQFPDDRRGIISKM
ncbi:hypothetical protein DV515_00015411 [Chloebia gouldiae]|uniref:Uncharacterized protein n=1 Tax=Chloebia gouldiae TaxID=44316 RepID=A0A3L8RVI0_CHLGU|nr:hypothetical protein DV515_00015411 [Chloebia gouldiae]